MAGLDLDLYSRQVYVLGEDAMKKVGESSVLISGLGGLGVEIAKNVCLAGVNSVCVHDTKQATICDLAANFYLNEKSIGKRDRAVECLASLSALNDHVHVTAITGDLNRETISRFTTVVITEARPQAKLDELSAWCREANVKLIITETRGVFGWLFVDFGPAFVSTNPGGEAPQPFSISGVSKESEALVQVSEGETHGLELGDEVKLSALCGMEELNDKVWEVTEVESPSEFRINADTREWSSYDAVLRSGTGEKVIVPKSLPFKSFWEALKDPSKHRVKSAAGGRRPFDWSGKGRDEQIALAFTASHSGGALLESAVEINGRCNVVPQVDEALFAEFERESGAVLAPVCSVFGGLAAHEVLKSVAGKFMPINQFVCAGFLEALPAQRIEFEPLGDRYDPYRQVFGNELQARMQRLKYFMVGAGAIGCELLKICALMGVGSDGGMITVSDPDGIERSNLNRQFLFQNSDIGKMKSERAVAAARAMNPDMRLTALTHKLCAETAEIFNDEFYEPLDGVCHALDNVAARVYSDQKCVQYGKPLMECGTKGACASLEAIVPKLTDHYQAPAVEAQVASCTLRFHPSTLAHCVTWARDLFCGLFEDAPGKVNKVIDDKDFLTHAHSLSGEAEGKGLEACACALQVVESTLGADDSRTWPGCVAWARRVFEENFTNNILELTALLPIDAKSSDDHPFWSGGKQFPTAARYDATNANHAAFVRTAARLQAKVLGVTVGDDAAVLAASVAVAPWTDSRLPLDIHDLDADPPDVPAPSPASPALLERVDALWASVSARVQGAAPLEVLKFEKDDEGNGHVDFVAAASNIRAASYKLREGERLEIKRIAGEIAPAIATSTAMVSGLVALELYKVHSLEPKPFKAFRAGAFNLAAGTFGYREAARAPVQECGRCEFTLWDKWEFDGDLTLRRIVEEIEAKCGLRVSVLSAEDRADARMLYNRFRLPKDYDQKVRDVVATRFGRMVEGTIALSVTCNNGAAPQDEEVPDIPTPAVLLKL
jgi:ubiquitin-activating enzyme E1